MPLKANDFIDLYIDLGAAHYELIPKLLETAREKHRDGFDPAKDLKALSLD